MARHTATMRERRRRMGTAKFIAFGLAVGLAAGPVISGLAGHLGPRRLPGPTSTAQAAARAGVVDPDVVHACAGKLTA